MSEPIWSEWVRKKRAYVRPRVQLLLVTVLTCALATTFAYIFQGQAGHSVAIGVASVSGLCSGSAAVQLIRWGRKEVPPFSAVVRSARCTAGPIAECEGLLWIELQMVADEVMRHLPEDKPLRRWQVYTLLVDFDEELHSSEALSF